MDTISGAALARQLGTSKPRVARAVKRLGIDARTPSGRLALTPAQARRVRIELGVVPSIEGFSRSEALTLAALRNAPLGLISIRAVAGRAGISPSAAGAALASLRKAGLAYREAKMIAAGRALRAELWRANLENAAWSALDPILDQVQAPTRPAKRPTSVPPRLRHLFWNTAPSQLEVAHAGSYIARRLLDTADLQGLAWGARALTAEDWRAGGQGRNLSRAVKALAENLASAAP